MFKNKLSSIRKSFGLSLEDAARALRVQERYLHRIETGKVSPFTKKGSHRNFVQKILNLYNLDFSEIWTTGRSRKGLERIPNELYKLRAPLGISARKAAAKIGISHALLSDFELGINSPVTSTGKVKKSAKKILGFYNVKIEDAWPGFDLEEEDLSASREMPMSVLQAEIFSMRKQLESTTRSMERLSRNVERLVELMC